MRPVIERDSLSYLLGLTAFNSGGPKVALDLFALSLLIMPQLGHALADQVARDLENLLIKLNYTEEERKELFQRVEEAIKTDNGSELVNKAAAVLRGWGLRTD